MKFAIWLATAIFCLLMVDTNSSSFEVQVSTRLACSHFREYFAVVFFNIGLGGSAEQTALLNVHSVFFKETTVLDIELGSLFVTKAIQNIISSVTKIIKALKTLSVYLSASVSATFQAAIDLVIPMSTTITTSLTAITEVPFKTVLDLMPDSVALQLQSMLLSIGKGFSRCASTILNKSFVTATLTSSLSITTKSYETQVTTHIDVQSTTLTSTLDLSIVFIGNLDSDTKFVCGSMADELSFDLTTFMNFDIKTSSAGKKRAAIFITNLTTEINEITATVSIKIVESVQKCRGFSVTLKSKMSIVRTYALNIIAQLKEIVEAEANASGTTTPAYACATNAISTIIRKITLISTYLSGCLDKRINRLNELIKQIKESYKCQIDKVKQTKGECKDSKEDRSGSNEDSSGSKEGDTSTENNADMYEECLKKKKYKAIGQMNSTVTDGFKEYLEEFDDLANRCVEVNINYLQVALEEEITKFKKCLGQPSIEFIDSSH